MLFLLVLQFPLEIGAAKHPFANYNLMLASLYSTTPTNPFTREPLTEPELQQLSTQFGISSLPAFKEIWTNALKRAVEKENETRARNRESLLTLQGAQEQRELFSEMETHERFTHLHKILLNQTDITRSPQELQQRQELLSQLQRMDPWTRQLSPPTRPSYL